MRPKTGIRREGRQHEVDAGSVETDELKTDQGTIWDQPSNDPYQQQSGLILQSTGPSVSSTTYATTGRLSGAVDATRVPNAATLYGRMTFNTGGSVDQETVVHPTVRDVTHSGNENLTELEVTIAQGATFTQHDSGWVEITTSSVADSLFFGKSLRAKLSTQTNGDSTTLTSNAEFGVVFEWRLD